jgi:hypothetical protein
MAENKINGISDVSAPTDADQRVTGFQNAVNDSASMSAGAFQSLERVTDALGDSTSLQD